MICIYNNNIYIYLSIFYILIYISIYSSIYLSINLFVYNISSLIYLSIYLFIYSFIYISTHVSISIHLFIHMSIYSYIYLPIFYKCILHNRKKQLYLEYLWYLWSIFKYVLWKNRWYHMQWMYIVCTCNMHLWQTKRYFMIDQQKARHFVHFSEYLSTSIPFYATQIIKNFLNSRISANHDKGLRFLPMMVKSLYSLMFL